MANYQYGDVITRGASQTASIIRGTFTLTANATSTIVPVHGCLPSSFMADPTPINQHAANDKATTSYAMGTDQFVVTHANNARTDRQFNFILFV